MISGEGNKLVEGDDCGLEGAMVSGRAIVIMTTMSGDEICRSVRNIGRNVGDGDSKTFAVLGKGGQLLAQHNKALTQLFTIDQYQLAAALKAYTGLSSNV